MIRDAARMQRWVLWGAPAVIVSALGARAGGGAAALGAWMLLGLLQPGRSGYPYPRKRRIRPCRMFFAWSLGALILALGDAAARRIWGARMPSWSLPSVFAALGAAFFSVTVSARTLRRTPPRAAAWAGGIAAALLALWLITAEPV